MSQPGVTVVIPAYNEQGYVGDAIRSVLAQSRDDFELIVVDDGSTDRTAAVVGQFDSDPRLRLIGQANRGLAASLNVGAAAGSAPLVALLDADDIWMPTFLERLTEALEADRSAGFAYTEAWWLDQERGRFFRKSTSEYMGAPSTPPTDREAFLLAVMPANWVFGLPMIRRSALEEVGGFNESLHACEDYELWIRLLARGFNAIRVPGRLVIQRDRSGSMSKDERSMLTNLRKVYEIAAREPGVPEKAREIARGRIREIDRQLEALARGRRPARRVARRWIAQGAKAVMARRFWYTETPPEVAAAFPDMDWGQE
jgi:glycosyltransferase involved in cell wall biosynthesis